MTMYDFIQRFILFVIPGVISCSIFYYLTGKKFSINIINALYIFVSSLVDFICGNWVIWLWNKGCWFDIPKVNITKIISGDNGTLSTSSMVIAIAISVIFSHIMLWIYEKNIAFNIINKVKITSRCGNGTIWDHLFENNSWVIVRDHITDIAYFGQVIKYSDGIEKFEILLNDVKVSPKDADDYKMESVYLCRKASEFTIEIDNYQRENTNNE